MGQPERSRIIKDMMLWVLARTKQGGCKRAELVRFVQLELTDLGAATRTVEKYLNDCLRHGLIEVEGNKYVCTCKGENWLEKKVS